MESKRLRIWIFWLDKGAQPREEDARLFVTGNQGQGVKTKLTAK